MAAPGRKIAAASARAHTRKRKNSGVSFRLPPGTFRKLSAFLLVVLLAWSYQAIKPPPSRVCGSANGPAITSPRIKLKDGRHLSYAEKGLPKGKAKHKIIFIHDFDSCKYDIFPISQRLIEELGIYMLSVDRAGYGESDPNPDLSEKSITKDIEELANYLELGLKFYVVGYGFGGEFIWPSLKYIPHRLAGAAIVAPVSNYWWPGFPANISQEAFRQLLVRDQWALRIAHYAPWLTYWWNTQKFFPSSSAIARWPNIYSIQEKELFVKLLAKDYKVQVRQQGEFESVHRDFIVGFGDWKFNPMELQNPFVNGEGLVHLWHGRDDSIAPVLLSRYISQKLPWIRYHELQDAGHMFPFADGMGDAIVKVLLLGNQQL